MYSATQLDANSGAAVSAKSSMLFFNWFKTKKDEFLEDVAAAQRSES